MDDRPDGNLSLDTAGADRVAFGPGAEGVARLRTHIDAEEVVEVVFTYTEADLSHALWFYLRHGSAKRLAALAVLVLSIGMLMALASGSLAPALVYLAISGFLLRSSYRVTAGRMLRRDQAWRQEQRWTISEDGLFVARPNAEGRLGWPAVQRIIESPEGFLVFPQAHLFHLLPKRCLTPEQIETVRAMMVVNSKYQKMG